MLFGLWFQIGSQQWQGRRDSWQPEEGRSHFQTQTCSRERELAAGEAMSSQLPPPWHTPPQSRQCATCWRTSVQTHRPVGDISQTPTDGAFKVRTPRHALRSPSGDWLRQVIGHQNSENLGILYSRSPPSMELGQGLQHPPGTLQNFTIQVLPGSSW